MNEIKEFYARLAATYGEWQALTMIIAAILFALASGASIGELVEYLGGL